MLFNSYIFIFIFLPICLVGYYLLNHFKKYTLSQLFLLAMSLWFYAYFNINYLFIIIISILINYFLYYLMKKININWKRRIILFLGIIINVGILFYYKYMDFFISNINVLFNKDYNLLHIVLPLGISFFTFQQLSFIIDSYKREIPNYSLLHYASFVTFFPQLIAGPIVTHDELIPQFLNKNLKHLNWDNLSRGIYSFTLGLTKKVIIADTFGIAVNYGYSNFETLNSASAIIIMLSYTIQIYFDFSGYSDMAIGIGKMFNIDLPMNFNSPYKALNINEFWSKWHITLTRFFTKYIYIPLGGNRKGKFKTYRNIMIVFLVSGLWHGANWTFIIWGLLHGLFSVFTRIFKKYFDKLNPIINWIITFSFINITWIFFRADNIKQALIIINRVFQFIFGPIPFEIKEAFEIPGFTFLKNNISSLNFFPFISLQLFFIIAFFIILNSKNVKEKMDEFKPTIKNTIITIFLLIWCIISFSGISTFLYFNF